MTVKQIMLFYELSCFIICVLLLNKALAEEPTAYTIFSLFIEELPGRRAGHHAGAAGRGIGWQSPGIKESDN